MDQNCSMQAYLDDYGKIVVDISSRFYNGLSDSFYLLTDTGEVKNCVIKSVESLHDCNHYTLIAPTDLKIGKEYVVVEEHGHRVSLQYRFIVQTPLFDQEFSYDGNDLGVTYHVDRSEFVLWAPTASRVTLDLEVEGKHHLLLMEREEKGIYRRVVNKDLQSATYVYLVKVNGIVTESIDPYGVSSNANGVRSAVINFKRFSHEFYDSNLPSFKHNTDSVIYEANVRDFSIHPNCGSSHPGKFLGLIETGTQLESMPTGFDYLCNLNISHLQLMPVCDFATVEENDADCFYNWGYDPSQFFTLEGSYSSNPNDPYCRIEEFMKVVSGYHKAGIRINMDMVFNHMYDRTLSSFEKVVPYYYFRLTDNGNPSNGSFCGNDLDSSKNMMRKCIIDACKMWIKRYHIDGFRFDLMGILDIVTMNEIVSECKAIKPDCMFYGEGWNMPTFLPEELKANQVNNASMPEVGHFNDYFRDRIKGNSNENAVGEKGFCSGNTYLIEDSKSCLSANSINHEFYKIFLNPTQSINYVECHDNATCWDKLKECCKEDVREVRMKKQKLMMGVIMVAQGVPFIHCGQEFCRTKYGNHNTYRSKDSINRIDWKRKNSYSEVVNYTKDMIALRRSLDCLRYQSATEIEEHVRFISHDYRVLEYQMNECSGNYKTVRVFINPSPTIFYLDLLETYHLLANEAGLIPQDFNVQNLAINPYTMVVVAL